MVAPHSYEDGKCKTCNEYEPSKGLAYKLNSGGSSYSVSGIGSCTDSRIVIPEYYNDKPVTIIAASAFKSTQSIQEVIVGKNITTIGMYAFEYCYSLGNVVLSDSVKTIEKQAFFDCGIDYITMGNGVETIGVQAFGWCVCLKSITLPVSLKSIGNKAFEYTKVLNEKIYNGTAAQWKQVDGNGEISVNCIG